MNERLESRDGEAQEPAPKVADPPPSFRARRYRSGYSRFVRLMRYVLPLAAGVFVLLLVLWPELEGDDGTFEVGISDLSIETAGGQRVLNARFTGVDGDNRPFSVTAASAVQPPDAKGRVDLVDPKADVTLQSNSWVAIMSPAGVFWREEEILDLSGGVDLYHDDGYEFHTETARVELRDRKASGDTPVQGQGPFGTIDAEGFRVLDGGDRIVFTGKARMMLYPNKVEGGASGAPGASEGGASEAKEGSAG